MHFFKLQYKATDMVIPGNGKLELIYTPEGGQEQRTTVFDFKNGGGCSMAMYNTDEVCNFINKYQNFMLRIGLCIGKDFPILYDTIFSDVIFDIFDLQFSFAL